MAQIILSRDQEAKIRLLPSIGVMFREVILWQKISGHTYNGVSLYSQK